ncbi:hypothetical protein H8K52_17960 [Undibacterium seohonense]|jgi:hypothetical protein|uniref:Uncharacterized protein n=1 Tax=Undibacterium seohonense TaxID=1344950 RepID=A0ABR6X993_9BURK|nr:hypothetical protein [Undibacterium seohonense]MBC3809228.1 hypothetical protein [Undibacterium seohonense]
MSWLISVRSASFEQSVNAGVITSLKCSITSTPCHTIAQLDVVPRGSGRNAGKKSYSQAEQVWQHVLSDLVGC